MKLRNQVRRFGSKLATGGALLMGSVSAFAVGPAAPDMTSLTPDFTTVTTAVLAVAGAVIGIYVTWKGAKIVIGAIKGA